MAKLGDHGAEGAEGEKAPEKDSATLEAEILADPELSPQDFARARTDNEFLSELVEKRRVTPPPEKKGEEGKGEGDGEKGKGEGDGEGDGKGEKGEGEKGEGEKGEGEKGKPQKRQGGFKRQVERLHDKIDSSERENARLRAQLAVKGEGKKKEPPVETSEPKEDDFDSHIEYIDALIDWRTDKRVTDALKKRDVKNATEKKANQKIATQHEAEAEVKTALKKQAKDSREEHEDWQEKVDLVDEAMAEEGLEWSDSQANAFALTGQFGEVAYYLGDHPEEAISLAKIAHPGKFLRALGKMEAKMEAEAAAAEKKVEKEKGEEGGGEVEVEKGKAAAPKKKTPLNPPVGESVKGKNSGTVKDSEYWANRATPQEYEDARGKRDRVGTGD